jgi:hypothetical protein
MPAQAGIHVFLLQKKSMDPRHKVTTVRLSLLRSVVTLGEGRGSTSFRCSTRKNPGPFVRRRLPRRSLRRPSPTHPCLRDSWDSWDSWDRWDRWDRWDSWDSWDTGTVGQRDSGTAGQRQLSAETASLRRSPLVHTPGSHALGRDPCPQTRCVYPGIPARCGNGTAALPVLRAAERRTPAMPIARRRRGSPWRRRRPRPNPAGSPAAWRA